MKTHLKILGVTISLILMLWLYLGNYGYGLDDGKISHEFIGWMNFLFAIAGTGMILFIAGIGYVSFELYQHHIRKQKQGTGNV